MRVLLVFMLCLMTSLPAMGKEVLIPLQKLSPKPVLALKCMSDEQGIEIPISDRWDIKAVSIDLQYISSVNLIGDLSQLIVNMNGIPIAQFKLNPKTPDARVKVNIPLLYLKPGYNTLKFKVVQHYTTKECESPCSPDLWTNINLQDSILHVEYEDKPVPLKLSAISEYLFDPKTYPEASVHFVVEDRSAETLTTAAIASSGIARRFNYRKVSFSMSQQIRPGVDNVVLGRSSFVSRFLAPFNLSLGNVEGGYLKIFPLPVGAGGYDVTHALLAVTGEKYDHVHMAAETLASISFAYPGSQELNAFEFSLPKVPPYGGRAVVIANKTYDFKTMDFDTTSFQGVNPVGKDLVFRLPADFVIQQNRSAKLSLNFAYGAGMRGDSALNILINDKIVRAVGFDKKSGDFLQNYVIDIPAYLFKPGRNIISFGVELHPDLQECDIKLMDNLFLTIFENSTFTFPDMPHFVELPKLELFMLNGFPFTRWPDGFESMIYLADTSDESISAALNMVGLMSQKNSFPLLNIKIGLTPPKEWEGDLIAISSSKQLPAEMKEKSPLRTSKTSMVPYPVVHGWEGESSLSFSRQASSLGEGRGLLMQFESPYHTGKTVMALVADSGADVLRLSEAMLDSGVQGQVFGDLVLVEFTQPKPRVTSMQVGEKYTTGKMGDVSRIESFFYAHPNLYYALLGVLILGFTYAIYVLLKRYRATRKLGQAQTKE